MSAQNRGSINPSPQPPVQMFNNAGTNPQESERQRKCRKACMPITIVCAVTAIVIYYPVMYATGIYKWG